MARIPPVGTGGGGADSGHGHGGHHKGRKPRRHHPHVKHPRTKHPHAHKPASHAPVAEPVRAASAWPHGAPAPGVIAALLALDPAALPAPDLLTLTGAEHGALHATRATLDAFTRQRDQTLNRVARRPGGLARMAGV